jgi:polyisoprenoid-binding protein YceI
MHGVTKPVTLTINKFKCGPHRSGREVCGADATATINREDFGVSFGKNFGFDMNVVLRIQVEAVVAS